MDQNIIAENTKGCLEKKKIFLAIFLNRKLIEIGNRKTAARNFNLDKLSSQKNTFQVRKGDKIFFFSVQESEEEEECSGGLALERTLYSRGGNSGNPRHKKSIFDPCHLLSAFRPPLPTTTPLPKPPIDTIFDLEILFQIFK